VETARRFRGPDARHRRYRAGAAGGRRRARAHRPPLINVTRARATPGAPAYKQTTARLTILQKCAFPRWRAESQTLRLLHPPRAVAARVQPSRAEASDGCERAASRAAQVPLHLVDEPRRILRDSRVRLEASTCRQRSGGGSRQFELERRAAHSRRRIERARER